MLSKRAVRIFFSLVASALLVACSAGAIDDQQTTRDRTAQEEVDAVPTRAGFHVMGRGSSFFDVLRLENQDRQISVNRYLWNASLETLSFLPIEAIDPFSGVIIFGYGIPPGGNRAYRATVQVKDPALAARSLLVSIQTRNGAVAEQTRRAVEDAILTRARQLRVEDKRF